MIEARRLTKRYGDTVVVDDVSFEVGAGELLAVVGESGSGKTTTLKLLNRLEEPTSGSVRIAGEDASRTPPHLLRRRIGYVFQRIGLFPHMTVRDNIGVTPSLLGANEARIRQRAAELLDLVGLGQGLADRYPSELSGGQQQRVAVARALAAEPQVVLLDEPFGALDPLTRDRLQQAFDRIRRDLGLTAVLVTHDMAEALLLSDRVAVLRGGRLLQIATPAEIVQRPANDHVERLIATPRRQAAAFDELAGKREHA
jgi:osmoprotectant transport system ATP-binding protein